MAQTDPSLHSSFSPPLLTFPLSGALFAPYLQALAVVIAFFSPSCLPPLLSSSFLLLFDGFSPPFAFLVLLDTVATEIFYQHHLVRCYCLSQFFI